MEHESTSCPLAQMVLSEFGAMKEGMRSIDKQLAVVVERIEHIAATTHVNAKAIDALRTDTDLAKGSVRGAGAVIGILAAVVGAFGTLLVNHLLGK